MDELRLNEVLGTIEQPVEADPAFLDRLYDDLAAEMGFASAAHRAQPVVRASTTRRSRRWWLLAAALLTLAMAGPALVAGALREVFDDQRTSVLETIREAGVLRAVVRDSSPQARSPEGALGGFDIDVAEELARRIGVAPEIRPVASIEDVASGDWDVALTSGIGDPDRLEGYGFSVPIYLWPVYVVVPVDSTIGSMSGLAGARICAVEGSPGAAWLAGNFDGPGATTINGPLDVEAVHRSDDETCLDALADGSVAATVTADLGPAGLGVRGGIRTLGGPVLTEERGLIVDRSVGEVGPLLAAIDAAIEAARADGTLSDLSRSRFGGHDLSAPPRGVQEEQ